MIHDSIVPLASILIPCFNAGHWISQAIESALAQTWPHKEVIVIDDGSTDDSLTGIREFGESIRWYSGPNRGGNATRNALLERAQGEWLQYLDADDYLLPHKIAAQMQTLQAAPDADIILSPIVMEWSESKAKQEVLPLPWPHDLWILLSRWHLPQTGAPLWRKQAIVDVGAWKEDQPCCQEHELYFRLVRAGKKFEFCNVPGAVYRQWGEQTVCKRDQPEVRRRRLDILKSIEHLLEHQGTSTFERLNAINQTRFEIARMAWLHDRQEALDIMATLQASQPGFIPKGDAAPANYRAFYHLLGFDRTEKLAKVQRQIRARLAT